MGDFTVYMGRIVDVVNFVLFKSWQLDSCDVIFSLFTLTHI